MLTMPTFPTAASKLVRRNQKRHDTQPVAPEYVAAMCALAQTYEAMLEYEAARFDGLARSASSAEERREYRKKYWAAIADLRMVRDIC